MKWRACIAVLTLACSAAEVTTLAQPSTIAHTTMLTSRAPQHTVTIPAFAVAPTVLTLSITAIENPSSQAFSLAAAVTWTAGGAPAINAAIGVVTPYPAGRAGSFQLAVPAPARALLVRKDGRLTIQLAVQPVAADRPLAEPLKVTLADLTWQ